MCTKCPAVGASVKCTCEQPRQNTPDEMIEVVKAIKEGKPLESRELGVNPELREWRARDGIRYPNFGMHQYRVKRVPRVYHAYMLGDTVHLLNSDEAVVDNAAKRSVRAKELVKTKFVEVLE